jgi:electron transport complex protein RnfA
MTEYLLILLGAVFVNNIVMVKILGLCPFMGVSGIVQFTEMIIQKTSPELYQTLGIYLPLITTNCAVLGVPLINVQAKHNFMESLIFGMGSALGFTLVMILFAGLRERMEGADVPGIFKGSAIAMITAGLMSLSFMGFSGLIK